MTVLGQSGQIDMKKIIFLFLASWLFLSFQPAPVWGETKEECAQRCSDSFITNCQLLPADCERGFDACLTPCETYTPSDITLPGYERRETGRPSPDATGFGAAKGQFQLTGQEAYGEGNVPTENLESRAASIVNVFLSVLGIFFLLLTTYGGLIWVTARGEEEKAKKARDIITRAVFGLLVVILAYAFSLFIFQFLIK